MIMAIKTASFTVNSFVTFTQGLLNVIQNPNLLSMLQNYSFSFYCIDIQDIKVGRKGRRKLKSQFKPVEDEKGVYIFFDKRTLRTLYVGAAGLTNGSSAVFYRIPGKGTTSGSGRVPQHLSGNARTSPIINYFNRNNPNSSTKGAYTRFINHYSILFICISPAGNTNNANIGAAITSLESSLISYLQPIV